MHTDKAKGIFFRAGSWPLDPGRPTLILIHGTGQSGVLWEHQLSSLADTANTVAVDLPGHGRSDPPACDRVADYACSLARFAESIAISNATPCGLSIGGAICQQLLLDYPRQFDAGILVCTGARLRVLPAFLEMVVKDYEGFLDVFRAYQVSEKTDRERVRAIMAVTADCPPAVVLGDFTACDRFDVMPRLAEIEQPVLVISAAEDRLTPPKYGEFLEKNIRGSRRVLIADAGHLVPLEQPEAFNSAVREFVGRF